MVEIVFLVLPYLRGFLQAHRGIKTENPVDIYYDVVSNIFEQINRNHQTKILMFLLHEDENFCKELTYADFIKVLPAIMRENKLAETFQILFALGVFD